MNDKHRPFQRRTVLKITGAGVVGGTVLTSSASAGHEDDHDPHRPANTPPGWFTTWGSDETQNWELNDTSGDRDEPVDESTKPYYLITKTGLGDSPHFGDFDQVVDTPPGNRGSFNANWHAHNLFYDNEGHEHDGKHYNGKQVLTGSGQVRVSPNDAEEGRTGWDEYLNTVDQIKEADQNGYAMEVSDKNNVPDAGFDFFVEFTFTCAVRPRNQGNGSRGS